MAAEGLDAVRAEMALEAADCSAFHYSPFHLLPFEFRAALPSPEGLNGDAESWLFRTVLPEEDASSGGGRVPAVFFEESGLGKDLSVFPWGAGAGTVVTDVVI